MTTYGSTSQLVPHFPAPAPALTTEPITYAATQPLKKNEPRKVIAPYIAEFCGTFALVFTAGCCGICGNPVWTATGIACTLMVLTYALAPVSGANFNPAVSLSLVLCGKLRPSVAVGYAVMQVLASLLAGLAYSTLFKSSIDFGPRSTFTGWEVFVVEFYYTAALCFVFLSCFASRRNNPQEDGNQFFALAIGFILVAAGNSAGGISGAVLNPAMSFGIDLTGFDGSRYWCWWYALFEFCGAALAAVLFHICRREDFLPDVNLAEVAPKLLVRLISEFIGTFFVVLTVGLSLMMKEQSTATAYAAAVMCVTYSLGSVSGSHLNPAVTLAIVLSGRRKCNLCDGLLYGFVQIVAGILAGRVFASVQRAGPTASDVIAVGPGESYTWSMALTCELVFTALLAFVTLSVTTVSPPASATRQNFYFALAIGSSITAGAVACGSVSGGLLNPAVSFGLSTASTWSFGSKAPPFHYCVTYSSWQLMGSVLAAALLLLTRPEEFSSRWKLLSI